MQNFCLRGYKFSRRKNAGGLLDHVSDNHLLKDDHVVKWIFT